MLVAPAFTFDPTIERIIEFQGYNRNAVINDGEMRDMKNLSSDEYPCLTQRKARVPFIDTEDPSWDAMDLQHPVHMIEKGSRNSDGTLSDMKLAVIDLVGDKYRFKYDGVEYNNFELSADTQMVAINSRICFFPEKMYFNVIPDEHGVHHTGTLWANMTASSSVHMSTDDTYQILTLANQLEASQFNTDDVVSIYCELHVGTNQYDYTQTPMVCAISKREGLSLYIPANTFLELAAAGATSAILRNVRIERPCPDLDFVMEYNNRLWGVDNKTNEIRASKLGDPTNWNYYQGTAMDSYAATQGTDGAWTGCAPYSGHLIFFKENYMHKVYGSKPSLYQISVATCYGLEKGSHKSVQIINDTVFYKSRIGIMAYSGGNPILASDAFGHEKYKNVVAGTDGKKYYASMQKEDGTYTLMVFDVAADLWHIEDDIRVTDFCHYKDHLLMLVNNQILKGNTDLEESGVEWMAEFGPFDEYVETKKIYSRLRMRLVMSAGSTLTVKMKIDRGEWETILEQAADEETALFIPIIPRRCDRFSVRLEGIGQTRIDSLARLYRAGTDGRDVKI